MSDKFYVGPAVRGLSRSNQFDGYTRVVLVVSDEIEYTAGSTTGRTLTINNPWGTQQIADDILARIKGYAYQPFSATGASVDPAAELGDGVTVGDIYGGMYTQKLTFNKLLKADISAPTDEEVDHEYPYVPAQERIVNRTLAQHSATLRIQADQIAAEVAQRISDVEEINAQLSIQADEISAKVSKTGGDSQSFGWNLFDDSWELNSNDQMVFRVDEEGAELRGKIVALSGKIGGLDIMSDYLSFNNQKWGGTNTSGLYLGPEGLQLGNNCQITIRGDIYAESGYFKGTVQAGNVAYGGDAGHMNGGAISSGSIWGGSGGQIGGGTLSTFNMTGGINSSLSHADWAYGAVNGWNTISSLRIVDGGFRLGTSSVLKASRQVMGPNGTPIWINYLTYT